MPDPHRPLFEIRDPVHGFVKLTKAEIEVVNCPTFQRLRDIKQLAVAHYVYPGATHTRLEHSIGCVHLSDLALTHLLSNECREKHVPFADAFSMSGCDLERARAILRLAALLHDLGHPPFSHSGEHMLPLLSDAFGTLGFEKDQMALGLLRDPTRRVTHEDMTAFLIRNSEVAEVIQRQYSSRGITVEDVIAVAVRPDAVFASATPAPILWLLNEILTWDFGTDRMDYLLRDAHHSGQPTGTFDFRRLLDSVALLEVPNEIGGSAQVDGETDKRGNVRLGVGGGGWLTAEQMVASRYLMYISLYFHKTKRIYEKHIERLLPMWTKEVFDSDTLPIDFERYSSLGDSSVMTFARSVATKPSHPGYVHARPFVDRRHFRLARELVPSDNLSELALRLDGVGGQHEPERLIDRKIDKGRLDSFLKWVSIQFGSEEALVDVANHSATKMFSQGGEVLVLVDGTVRYLGEVSEIVRGMLDRVWRCRVYAPEHVRERVRSECGTWLSQNTPKKVIWNVERKGA